MRDGKIVSEPKHLGARLGRIRFRESARQTSPHHQRRGDAGARQLSRSPNALSRTRDRTRVRAGLGQYVLSLELGDLPYRNGRIIEDYLGKAGLERLGEKAWQREFSTRRAIKEVTHRRLCRARRRQRQEVERVPEGN